MKHPIFKKYFLPFLLAIMPLCMTAQNERKADDLLLDAVSRFNNHDYQGAIQLLSPIVDKMPGYDAAHYYLGMCYSYSGDLEKAASQLREAVKLDSSNFWYKDRLARVYAASQQSELAAAIYEDLTRDYPKNTDLYYTLVQIYMQQGKTDKVLQTLDEIDTVAGKGEMTTLYKFDVLMREKRADDAYKVLEDYNREYTSAQVLATMGDYNLSQFNDTLALRYYQEALSYESDCVPALLGLSETYRFKRNYPEFFRALNVIIKSESTPLDTKTRYLTSLFQHTEPQFIKTFRPQLDSAFTIYMESAPEDSLVLQTVSNWYYASARNEKALEMIRKNCQLYPESLSSRAMLTQLLGLSEKWGELKDEAQRAYDDFPREAGFLELKTSADYYMKDYQGFLEDSQTLLQTAPGDSALMLHIFSSMGDVYHILGESSRAYAVYEKALKINPDYLPVLNNYAYYLSLDKKKLKKAYAMSKKTIELEPDNPTYLDTFGWILFLQGKALEAKPFFKHAMLYGGKESAAVLDHYAEVLYALKEYDLAKVYWGLARSKNTGSEIPDLEDRIKTRLDAIER